jgi:hypothetical protein
LIRGYAHSQLLNVEFIFNILGTNDLLLSDVNHIASKAFHAALDSKQRVLDGVEGKLIPCGDYARHRILFIGRAERLVHSPTW